MSSLSAVAARDLPIGKLRASFPTSWPMDRFGALFTESAERNGSSPKGIALSVSEYHGVIPRDDSDGQRASSDVSVYRVLHPGELAVNYMWLNRGGLGVSDLLGYISPAYKVYRIDPSVYPRFAHYLLRSRPYVSAFAALGTGVRPNSQMVDTVELNSLPVPSIPFATQRAIADYLDRETAEIDAMTADLDEMEKLLTQRRSVRYSNTVFGRDLEANLQRVTPRSLSDHRGWVGKIPEHWNVVPLSLLFRERSEKNLADDPHLTPSQRYGVVTQEAYVKTSGATVVKNLKGANSMKHVEPGDFVSHLRSFQGGLELSRLRGKVSAAYTVLKCSRRVDVNYYRHLFKSADFIHGLSHLTNQLRDGQTINFARLEKLVLPVPPLEEQRRIAAEIDRETAEIDAMLADITELRDLLAERRAAVIAAAVTGQIDIPTPEETTYA